MTATAHTFFRDLASSSSSSPSGRSPRTRGTSLLEDERGAVMLTGLFMACFLIGSLWFLIGIGDTIVFRNKMQEAADSTAFTSAALHAKGMNFIALCNLVMLVGTVIHLVLGVIHDILFAIMIVACINGAKDGAIIGSIIPILGTIVGTAAGCIAEATVPFNRWKTARNTWQRYFNGMKTGFKAIYVAQTTASYAYPAFGVIEGYQNGSKYGGDKRTGPVHVVALSTSLIPGVGSFKKRALPVEPRKYSDLCDTTLKLPSATLQDFLGVSGQSTASDVLSWVEAIVGGVLKFRYCNGGGKGSPLTEHIPKPLVSWFSDLLNDPGWNAFWSEEGSYKVYSQAKNGNDWMQTWALNISPKVKDTSEARVGFASKQYRNYTTEEGAALYVSQAEFYFDCDGEWKDPGCNGNGHEHAMFAIKWRARMRRVELPSLASMAAGASLDAVTSAEVYSDAKKSVVGDLMDAMNASGVGRAALTAAVNKAAGKVEGLIKGELTGPAGKYNPSFNMFGITPYH